MMLTRPIPLRATGFNASEAQIASTTAKGAALVGVATGIPVIGPIAALGAAIASLFGGGTKQLTTQDVLDDITPAVVNNLQNAGLSLPAGQEQQYVQAALTGQLPTASVNYWIPATIAGAAVALLLM